MKLAGKQYIFCVLATILLTIISLTAAAQNPLTKYAGTYERVVGNYHATVTVYIKDNKLRAKQSWDRKVRTFEQVGNDKFIIAMDGWAVEFKRDKQNKVAQMKVLGNEVWVKKQTDATAVYSFRMF
ncbi:DUF3471 domain-containing protein [Mucilaginibacter auburnensis]|uniref:Uncharacterized protein DUF3471 n=1 Tax=Mucilaginibacter auburnensis TaxID=1457233 RepID=A0A2H9VQS3_9SPHI|nr:DUF3471 domain-containing protein [Mucilaginibacter auburnensis]PJJ83118.1 uncharacterized protein DUF3471 [Mucilaginibacter auburnensis]